MEAIETEKILEALLAIGDQRTVAPIEKYLKGHYPEQSKAVAHRVLVQLKSPNPILELLELLDTEPYEPERSDLISALAKSSRQANCQEIRHHCPHVGISVHAELGDSRFVSNGR